MRAILTLRRQLQKHIDFVHAKRQEAIFRAVTGVVNGGRLWLSALGRSLPGKCAEKHRIKAVDRLLGNSALRDELPLLYRALAGWLLGRTAKPVLLVDATDLAPGMCELRAALCFEGRAMTLYSEIHPQGSDQNPAVHRHFLGALFRILPSNCRPIIVTDAGFRIAWFEEVSRLGWDFVGRLRHQTQLFLNEQWTPNHDLLPLAGHREKDLGLLLIRRGDPRACRIVLAKRRRSNHRIRRSRCGDPLHATKDVRYTQSARDPWILATSLTDCSSDSIVRIYSHRMQIEESFRDFKSSRFGWAASSARSQSYARLNVLTFIGIVASLLVTLAGLASERLGLQRRFQANTIRTRRVISLFFLGCRALRAGVRLPAPVLQSAISAARLIFRRASPA